MGIEPTMVPLGEEQRLKQLKLISSLPVPFYHITGFADQAGRQPRYPSKLIFFTAQPSSLGELPLSQVICPT